MRVNTMETIIKKAIEGGWSTWLKEDNYWISGEYIFWKTHIIKDEFEQRKMTFHEAFMDPLFWHYLGDSLAWFPWVQTRNGVKVCFLEEHEKRKRQSELGVSPVGGPLIEYVPTHIFYGALFHEMNLVEGFDKAVSWLEALVTKER